MVSDGRQGLLMTLPPVCFLYTKQNTGGGFPRRRCNSRLPYKFDLIEARPLQIFESQEGAVKIGEGRFRIIRAHDTCMRPFRDRQDVPQFGGVSEFDLIACFRRIEELCGCHWILSSRLLTSLWKNLT